ncbi:hypothetical protein EDI_011080 [Entamoeba dispar SAW760]|uniref:Uncharacterized protein n=1 Tax=Entamoeba dispar (strain ATCC PRA-260 / SAW760) TaxID=370354 RepID=B0ES83_ENTDS|nr:uncharacterized protein EDI_011080 [Entamoeba dispar SAW760]EDR22608.1 hypothetical protein EDI_011080 [Entamoeba dispar SAW760]|eukprot:EDR22608.1 hypothetical protein EDI_011080 [Entamoeba dispar SAW760]
MSIDIDERCEYYPLEDIVLNALHDYYVDLEDLQSLCEDMKFLCQKEQMIPCCSVKYSKLIEDDAYLVEDIANLSSKMVKLHKNVIDAFKRCRENREKKLTEITKPKK